MNKEISMLRSDRLAEAMATMPPSYEKNVIIQPKDTSRRTLSSGRLLHYSERPLTRIYSVVGQSIESKPNGLWISHGAAWAEWCLGEEFRLDRLQHCTEIHLDPDANLLWIKNETQLDAFQQEYVVFTRPYHNHQITMDSALWIDWEGVALRYQGVMIAPSYIYSRRLTAMWYYGWDCASGCIWDMSAIESITAVPWLGIALGEEDGLDVEI